MALLVTRTNVISVLNTDLNQYTKDELIQIITMYKDMVTEHLNDIDIKHKTYDNLIESLEEILDKKSLKIDELNRQLSNNIKDTIAVPV